VVVDPEGKFVFAANFGDSTISVFSIGKKSGALTEVSGSPFAAQGSSDELTIDPMGHFLYAANDGSTGPSGVGAFSINRKTGALSPVPGSPFVTGTSSTSSTSGVTIDPMNHFLFGANENGNTISVFSIDKKTGVLTEISGSPFTAGGVNTEPVKIVIRR
jgi:6-phosphogluconolactonase